MEENQGSQFKFPLARHITKTSLEILRLAMNRADTNLKLISLESKIHLRI
jgi:hypothetical protein